MYKLLNTGELKADGYGKHKVYQIEPYRRIDFECLGYGVYEDRQLKEVSISESDIDLTGVYNKGLGWAYIWQSPNLFQKVFLSNKKENIYSIQG